MCLSEAKQDKINHFQITDYLLQMSTRVVSCKFFCEGEKRQFITPYLLATSIALFPFRRASRASPQDRTLVQCAIMIFPCMKYTEAKTLYKRLLIEVFVKDIKSNRYCKIRVQKPKTVLSTHKSSFNDKIKLIKSRSRPSHSYTGKIKNLFCYEESNLLYTFSNMQVQLSRSTMISNQAYRHK